MIKPTLTLGLAAIAAASTYAGSTSAPAKSVEAEKEKSIYDSIWAIPVLYRNPDAEFFNELRLTGRFHGDVYSLDSDLGYDSDWIVRRLRFGAKALFFHNRLTLHVESEYAPQDPNPFYNRLTDAYVGWEFSKALNLKVGKQPVPFTLDGASSNTLITIDRNALTNNLWFGLEYMPGVSLSGKIGNWQYFTGFYSGGTASPEFGNMDAGNFAVANLGYDFGKALGVKKALLRADYVYNQRNVESTFTRPFENIGSVTFQLDAGKWGLSTDISAATGFAGQPDTWGFVFMPWYNITDKLQLVGRYTYIESDGNNGIRLSRYENVMTSGRGDEYQEFYAGLNYYLYGHKLKVQTGLTYVTMDDAANDGGRYNGWCWTTGLRVSW